MIPMGSTLAALGVGVQDHGFSVRYPDMQLKGSGEGEDDTMAGGRPRSTSHSVWLATAAQSHYERKEQVKSFQLSGSLPWLHIESPGET